jgi:hypothetical protein
VVELCGDRRLVLRSQSIGSLLDGRCLELLLRGSREILALVSWVGGLSGGSWRGRAGTSASDQILSFGRIVSNILFCGIGGARSVVAGELLDLLGLLVNNAGSIRDVVVNELLVGLVDEGRNEEDGGGDESKTPQWDDLDQVVREESTEEGLTMLVSAFVRLWGWITYSNRGKHVLCKDNALRLNDEEVDELIEVTSDAIEGRLGNSEILLWAKLGRQALAKDGLTKHFRCNCNPKSHPCKLEAIPENVKVPGSEDEDDAGDEGNGRDARIIP